MAYASINNAVLIDGCKNLQNLSVLLLAPRRRHDRRERLELSAQLLSAGGRVVPGQSAQLPPIHRLRAGRHCLRDSVWANGVRHVAVGLHAAAGHDAVAALLGQRLLPLRALRPLSTATRYRLIRSSRLRSRRTGSVSVTKVTFTYTDPDDNGHSAEFDPPAVHPIVACQLNFVGPGGSRHANFTQGLTKSRGVIYYSVSSGQLSVQNGGPGAACGEAVAFTGETSNMTYGDISHAPASTVTQILQQAIACAGDTLFAADRHAGRSVAAGSG